MANGWKITAIIFIILFILEAVFIGWIIKVGIDYVESEDECAYNLCKDNEAFLYSEGVCYCFDDGQEVKKEYIG